MSDILVADNICKKYSDTDGAVLNHVSLQIKQGEIVALLGQSGSGKSTLLHILGLLDTPTSGNILFKNVNTNLLDKPKTRCKHFGFVYQFHNLLQEFSAKENVIIPQLINGVSRKEANERASHLLRIFGVENRANFLPAALSGGQRQRVAIARAIANCPDVLFADEPTGSLDSKTSDLVISELLKILKEFKISAIIATHNIEIANRLDRKIEF